METFAICERASIEEAYLSGAEYGYKVAIASVREWMYDNARNYVDGVFWYDHMMSDFETDMNKLWEDKK